MPERGSLTASEAVDQAAERLFKHRILTREEEVILAKRIERGDQAAFDELLLCNMKLVASIAGKKVFKAKSLTRDDLIIEGVMGLNRAVEKFEWRKGFKFSTYATWWIKQSIDRAIANSDALIRVPVNHLPLQKQIFDFVASQEQQHDFRPSYATIAAHFDVEASLVEDLITAGGPVSLDRPVGDDTGTSSLGDFIASTAPDTVDLVDTGIKQDAVTGAIAALDPEAQAVVVALHMDGRKLTEAADELCLPVEQVRSIEHRAMRQLQKSLSQFDPALAAA